MKMEKAKTGFAQVANSVLNNKSLSFKAKGLYAYLWSKDDGYDFSIYRIVRDSSDGLSSIRSTIKELEEFGLLTREKLPTGRTKYLLWIKPCMENQHLALKEKALCRKSQGAKIAPLTNTDKETKKEKTNKNDFLLNSPFGRQLTQKVSDSIKSNSKWLAVDK